MNTKLLVRAHTKFMTLSHSLGVIVYEGRRLLAHSASIFIVNRSPCSWSHYNANSLSLTTIDPWKPFSFLAYLSISPDVSSFMCFSLSRRESQSERKKCVMYQGATCSSEQSNSSCCSMRNHSSDWRWEEEREMKLNPITEHKHLELIWISLG